MFLVSAAVCPCHHDRIADRHAVEKADQKVRDRPADADRRQSRFTDEVAYDQRIRAVVQILQQLAQNDGDRKEDQFLYDWSFGEIDAAPRCPLHIPSSLFTASV